MPYKDPEKAKTYQRVYYLNHQKERKAYKKAYYLTYQDEAKAKARPYYLAHREEMKTRNKAYRLAHKEEIRAYRLAHKEEIRAKSKAYYMAHKEEIRAKMKVYGLVHRKEARAYVRAYFQTPKGKVVMCKRNAKRKQFGFIPLNKPFKGSDGHHVDKHHVIYIPKELHENIKHSVLQNRNMGTINAKALEFIEQNKPLPLF
jgi:hypothetical protein